ncbi:MAG: hypothetical protein ACU0AY_15645 [Marinibacterium profundimaris]
MSRDKSDKTPAAPETADKERPRPYFRGEDGTHPLDKSFKLKPGSVVETIGGDELQTRRITHGGDGPSSSIEVVFWDDLETILANCDEVMLRHGWDRKAGNGSDFPGDRTADAFSELWYAGKIGRECRDLLTRYRERGINEFALAGAMYLGRLLTEAKWRADFKPAVLTGRKQRQTLAGLREGQNRRAKAGVAHRRKLVEDLMSENNLTGGALDLWLARQLAERHGIEISTRTLRADRRALFLRGEAAEEANQAKLGMDR